MSPWSRLRMLLWRNPLLVQRLQRSTAYTWDNLTLACVLLVAIGSTIVRVWCWVHAHLYLSALPREIAEMDRLQLLGSRTEYVLRRHTLGLGYSDRPSFSFPEYAAAFLLAACLVLVYLLAFRRAVSGYRYRRRWDRLDTDDIGVLPVSPGQVMAARHDWPLLKCLAVLFTVPLLMLLPARDDAVFFLGPMWYDFPPLDVDLFLAGATFTLGTALFVSFRETQMSARYGIRGERLGFLFRVLLLVIVATFFVHVLLYWRLLVRYFSAWSAACAVAVAVLLAVWLIRRLLRDRKIPSLRFDVWLAAWITLMMIHLVIAVDLGMTTSMGPAWAWNTLLVTGTLSNLAAWRAISMAPTVLAAEEDFRAPADGPKRRPRRAATPVPEDREAELAAAP